MAIKSYIAWDKEVFRYVALNPLRYGDSERNQVVFHFYKASQLRNQILTYFLADVTLVFSSKTSLTCFHSCDVSN